MIIKSKSGLELAENHMEVIANRDAAFPYICTFDEGRNFIGNEVPWHWNDQIEIDYVSRGTLKTTTSDRTYVQKPGEILVLNTGTLHAVRFLPETEWYVNQVDVRFLSGGYGSAIEQKYFTPLLCCESASSMLFRPDSANRIKMADYLIRAMEAMRDEPAGFELIAREALSRFWLCMFEETAELRRTGVPSGNQDAERMKAMLLFLYAHYAEPVTLTDIADAAGISSRECTRCFRRSVGSSPIRFLVSFRAQSAAQKLATTDDPVSVIAGACGFTSDSYFGKVFREMFGCTPREYRKRARSTARGENSAVSAGNISGTRGATSRRIF